MFPYSELSEVSGDWQSEESLPHTGDGGDWPWRSPRFSVCELLLVSRLKMACSGGHQGSDQPKTHSEIRLGELLFGLKI